MSSSDIITIARQTVWVIVKTSVPLLLVSMVVGLIISLFHLREQRAKVRACTRPWRLS